MTNLPDRLKQFIDQSKWTFAKTYAPRWPHEYIVQEEVDGELFEELAQHVDEHGYESHFYQSKQIYFDHDGHTYWHEENIINRCLEADTYARREKEGRLPKDKKL